MNINDLTITVASIVLVISVSINVYQFFSGRRKDVKKDTEQDMQKDLEINLLKEKMELSQKDREQLNKIVKEIETKITINQKDSIELIHNLQLEFNKSFAVLSENFASKFAKMEGRYQTLENMISHRINIKGENI